MSEFENLGKLEVPQDDGAVWTAFYDRENFDDHYLILTSSGRGLLLGENGTTYPELKQLFQDYRTAEEDDTSDIRRRYLGSGQQATVYGMSWLAVREVAGKQGFYRTLSELQSMDRLAGIVEGGLPRWINVPHMFACYADPATQKRYMLMQKIDTGLTAEDVMYYPDIGDHEASRTIAELGRIPTKEDVNDVKRLFVMARSILDDVLASKGFNPDDILTDWEPRNVIVESLRTPIAGERFSLSIIDQYK